MRLNGGGVEFVHDRGCNGKPKDIRIFRLGFPHAQLLASDNHLVSAQSYVAGYQPADLRLIDSPNHVLCFEHERTKGPEHRVSIALRVIAEELLLKFESRTTIPRKGRLAHGEKHLLDVCPHIHSTHGLSGLAEWETVYLDDHPNAVSKRCGFYHTECLVEHQKIQYEGQEGMSLRLCVWRNLGSLKSHYNEKWQRQKSSNFVKYYLRPFKVLPGSVRDVFETEDNREGV